MLPLMSLLLAAVGLSMAWLYRANVLHPAFWTNLGFVGYAVGGLYYAGFGFQQAAFLNLAGIDIDRSWWFSLAALIVFIGCLAANIGFALGDRLGSKGRSGELSPDLLSRPFAREVTAFGKAAALVLIALGIAYWFYFADMVAGGVLALFAQVAAYRYLAVDAGMSALPFHLAYGGIQLWMLLWLSEQRRWIGLLPVPIGMVMILSTGRISLAMAYGFVLLISYVAMTHGRAGWKAFILSFLALLPISVSFYFFRQYTSYAYVGRPDDFPLFTREPDAASTNEPPDTLGNKPQDALGGSKPHDALGHDNETGSVISGIFEPYAERVHYVIESLIGGGNVPDLQQIILIVKGLLNERLSLEYGATYLDWVRNFLGSRVGAPNEPINSVGYRILREYFPDKVGGPTPGMIGEAIINFGPLAPIAIVILTLSVTLIYWHVVRSNSILATFIFCQFLVGTWALFLKVDSSLFLSFLYAAAPISACWMGLKLLDRISKWHFLTPLFGSQGRQGNNLD